MTDDDERPEPSEQGVWTSPSDGASTRGGRARRGPPAQGPQASWGQPQPWTLPPPAARPTRRSRRVTGLVVAGALLLLGIVLAALTRVR